MRTTTRLTLAVAVVATAGLVAMPATAGARSHSPAKAYISITTFEKKQNRRIRRAHTRIANLKEWSFGLAAKNKEQDTSISGLQGTVNAIVAGVPAIVGGLQALQAALENDVAPALTAIDAALKDETTGLVGLNLARPQFGAFEPSGNFIDGTGAKGGQGPDSDASTNGGGIYVVNFNNDVSAKVYSVNVFPQGPLGAGATPHGEAANCDAHPAYRAACVTINGGELEASQYVLVQIDAVPVAGFTVAAISG